MKVSTSKNIEILPFGGKDFDIDIKSNKKTWHKSSLDSQNINDERGLKSTATTALLESYLTDAIREGMQF